MHNNKNENNYGLVNFPVNPLEEKWRKLYPMDDKCKEMEEKNIKNLYCDNCGKCPKGCDFKVPKEDLIIFRKYLKECRDYLEIHNPYKKIILKKSYDKK